MIKLYWWRPTDTSKINIGDEIGPRIVAALSGQEIVRAKPKDCEMISVGSILFAAIRRKVFETRQEPIHVWGSGTLVAKPVPAGTNYVYWALRGPLTRSLADCPQDLPTGDPGILASRIWKASGTKRYSWGIVPHLSQLRSPLAVSLHQETPRSVIVDVTDPDVDRTMDIISSCERIASTSLHGLIIADAFGIPNVWLAPTDLHGGKSWKFFDYFTSVGRTRFEPTAWPADFNLSGLAPAQLQDGHFSSIPACQDRILASFPAHWRAPASV